MPPGWFKKVVIAISRCLYALKISILKRPMLVKDSHRSVLTCTAKDLMCALLVHKEQFQCYVIDEMYRDGQPLTCLFGLLVTCYLRLVEVQEPGVHEGLQLIHVLLQASRMVVKEQCSGFDTGNMIEFMMTCMDMRITSEDRSQNLMCLHAKACASLLSEVCEWWLQNKDCTLRVPSHDSLVRVFSTAYDICEKPHVHRLCTIFACIMRLDPVRLESASGSYIGINKALLNGAISIMRSGTCTEHTNLIAVEYTSCALSFLVEHSEDPADLHAGEALDACRAALHLVDTGVKCKGLCNGRGPKQLLRYETDLLQILHSHIRMSKATFEASTAFGGLHQVSDTCAGALDRFLTHIMSHEHTPMICQHLSGMQKHMWEGARKRRRRHSIRNADTLVDDGNKEFERQLELWQMAACVARECDDPGVFQKHVCRLENMLKYLR